MQDASGVEQYVCLNYNWYFKREADYEYATSQLKDSKSQERCTTSDQ